MIEPDGVQIRAPREDDTVADGVPPLRPDERTWLRTRVAIAGGRCVGAASLALSPATDSYFCEVNVAPDYRRQRIGTRLYAAVYELLDQPFPVLARAMKSQPLRRRFAESIGCSVLLHCPEPWIDPTSPAGQQWIGQQSLPPSCTTAAMSELSCERVGHAWASYFDWAHQPFGVVHTDRLPQLWAELHDGLDPDGSMLSVDSATDDIVALSLVTPDAWDGRTMIISETVRKDQPDGDRLLRSTVAASLHVLAQREIRRVELEGHTTDVHSPALVQSLPPGGGDPMDILKLTPPK